MGSGAVEGDGEPSGTNAASNNPPRPAKPVRIDNAGMVLLSPYLPALFDRAGLLARTAARIGTADIPRALRLLDYLAHGRAEASHPGVELDRILCGIPLSQPVEASPDLSDHDASLCDGLITAAISNWSALGHTSPAGLRETFLQRHGELGRESGHLRLTVERKTLDVLVQQVPWSFSRIRHGWMPELLQVVW